MSTVLVTGGSGFIGSYCILQLLGAGHMPCNSWAQGIWSTPRCEILRAKPKCALC